jgi:hypothetical protein
MKHEPAPTIRHDGNTWTPMPELGQDVYGRELQEHEWTGDPPDGGWKHMVATKGKPLQLLTLPEQLR